MVEVHSWPREQLRSVPKSELRNLPLHFFLGAIAPRLHEFLGARLKLVELCMEVFKLSLRSRLESGEPLVFRLCVGGGPHLLDDGARVADRVRECMLLGKPGRLDELNAPALFS